MQAFLGELALRPSPQTYETANLSLWQSDEEVNKRIKQKYTYISTNCPAFRFENKPSPGAKRKMEKVRYKCLLNREQHYFPIVLFA